MKSPPLEDCVTDSLVGGWVSTASCAGPGTAAFRLALGATACAFAAAGVSAAAPARPAPLRKLRRARVGESLRRLGKASSHDVRPNPKGSGAARFIGQVSRRARRAVKAATATPGASVAYRFVGPARRRWGRPTQPEGGCPTEDAAQSWQSHQTRIDGRPHASVRGGGLSGITGDRIPVLHPGQPLEGIAPLVQHPIIQIIRKWLTLAAGSKIAAPESVAAVILREQHTWRPQLGRCQKLRDIRSERRHDLIAQPPRVAGAGGQTQGLDLADDPEQRPLRLLMPAERVALLRRRRWILQKRPLLGCD